MEVLVVCGAILLILAIGAAMNRAVCEARIHDLRQANRLLSEASNKAREDAAWWKSQHDDVLRVTKVLSKKGAETNVLSLPDRRAR